LGLIFGFTEVKSKRNTKKDMNEATPTNYFFLFLEAVFFIACLSSALP
jgi:hypothetical protein